MNWRAIAVRAAKTFFQAFLASISYGLTTTSNTSSTALRALIVAALAAGLSAVSNLYIKPNEAK